MAKIVSVYDRHLNAPWGSTIMEIALGPKNYRNIKKIGKLNVDNLLVYCTMHECTLSTSSVVPKLIILNSKVRLVVAKIRDAASKCTAIDMSDLLNAFTNDIVCHAVSGKLFREQGHNKLFRELVEANSSLIGGFNLEDYFPVLVKLDFIKRMVCAKAQKVNKMWDELLNSLIDEHASRPTSEQGGDDSDFINVLLSIQQEYDLTGDHIKAQLEV